MLSIEKKRIARSTRWLRGQVQVFLSGTVLLALLLVLWNEFQTKENLEQIWYSFGQQLEGANVLWLAFALLLMPLNWLAETLKWRAFVGQYQPLPLGRALLAVWVGVSFSLFTPYRIGEYGGRIVLIKPEHRWKAAIANVIGNISQYLVLLFTGIAGAYLLFRQLGWFAPFWLNAAAGIALAGILLLLVGYLNLKRLASLIKRLPLPARWQFLKKELEILRQFNPSELSAILAWSATRYFIYASQYFLLLQFFGISPGIITGYAGIAAIFLVQTSLPLPPLTALLARGHLALQVWPLLGGNEVSSLAATFVLWIINLILPALIGTFSLFYVSIANATGYEDD